jgi:pyruvate formate lyase activating enzyme
VPLIPGYNDSERNLRETAELGIKVKAEKLSLLHYHEWGKTKYTKLGRRYTWRQNKSPSKNNLQTIKSFVEELGIKVSIGS